MRKLFYILILILPLTAVAQQESYYSLYRYNMNVINPAYAGAEASNMLSLLSRRQWSQMEDAPNTIAFAYSSARENNVGLGLSVVSDRVFIEQQTFAYIDFSYKLTMSDDSNLYLGLKGGGNFYRADPTDLSTYASAPDAAQRQLSRFIPNIGAGAYYSAPQYWVSFSIPRLFSVKRDQEDIVTARDRVHAYLGAGGNIALGSNLIAKPSVMLRKVEGLPVGTEFTGMLSWQNMFDIGVSARSTSAMSILSVINLGAFEVGYAYETPTDNQLSALGMTTHEIVLRIKLGGGDDGEKQGPESTKE